MGMFDGRVVLVTGAAMGIGAAIARLFAERGASLVLFDRNEAEGEAIRSELEAAGSGVELVIGDVSDSGACNAAVERAVGRFGRLDVLVNNAGGGRLSPTHELSDEDWRHMQAINLDGTFYMSRAAIRVMLAKGGGAIVNIASVHGHVGFPDHAGYTAAKGAIVNMTRAMGVEYASRNIRVNAVCPGVIMTPLIERTIGEDGAKGLIGLHPMGRLGRPDEVARTVCFLASDEASFTTGSSLMVDGGYTAQ